MLAKASEAYKLWHGFLIRFPRLSKYTLGAEIDSLFLETIELIIHASYASREQRLVVVQKANVKFDQLKFLLQISWELKLLDHKKYLALSTPLSETGKMLGGWTKYLQKQTPPQKGGE